MNAWRTEMMTDHQLTEMVLRVMREQLEEKIRPSAPEFQDMDNPANHPAVPAAPLKMN